MKKILYNALVVFCLWPILCAILLSIIEKIHPEPFTINYSLYPLGVWQYASFIWPNLLMFYSIKFLLIGWMPYLLIQIAGEKNRFLTHIIFRFLSIVVLHTILIILNNMYGDYFRSGNTLLKWVCFLVVISAILSLLPIRWALNKGKKQKNNFSIESTKKV